MIFASVAAPVPARAGSLFTYAVPPGMNVRPGNLVVAPFSSRVLTVIVAQVASVASDIRRRDLRRRPAIA